MLGARGVQDSLEHFDERIDEWFETSDRHNIMDRSIGDARIIEGSKRPTLPAGSIPGRASSRSSDTVCTCRVW